jgi:aspartate aminotransferase
MYLSRIAREIAESPTFALNEEARVLRERGEPVINLGIGEPKNKAPISAILSSAANLTSGEVKYSPPDGTPSLKKAIIRYTDENYERIIRPENVIVSAGAKQSLFNIFYSIINPQDEVIIFAPYWVSYPEMIKMCMGIPVIITPEDGTFYPSMQEIEKSISPYTRAIVVNSPNNPSGCIYPQEFIAELVNYCELKKIYLIMDDIYHKLYFDGNKPIPGYHFTNKDVESSMIIVVNGISKLYGMTGFRIGWVVTNKKLVQVMTNVQAQTTSCTSIVLQAAAEGALLGLQSIVENLRLTFQNNRNVIMQEMKTIPDVYSVKPEGTFYCLPDFRLISRDSVALSKLILSKAFVVTVPGKEFGLEGYLRLSFAGTINEITSAIERIKWVVDPNSPSEIIIGERRFVRDWI